MAEADRKKKRITMLSLVGAFLIACAAGAGGYIFMNSETGPKPDEVVRIDNMMANLAGGSFVKLSVTVVMSANDDPAKQEDIFRDSLISHLRTVDKADLDGVAGLDFLRSSLLGGARLAAGDDSVKEVLIREFIVQ